MPKSLRLYIATVVTISAIALVVATFVFEAKDPIALRVWTSPSQAALPIEILLGISFWTVLALVASASPVKQPRGTQQAVGVAPVLAALFLGGPAVGAWVAAIGTTEGRE